MKIKEILKRVIFNFIKPYIIFESVPDFSDNTRPVYEELVRRGYGKKYNLVWYVDSDRAAYLENGTPKYWNPRDTSSIRKYLRHYGYYEKVKAIVLCNRFIVPNGSFNSEITFNLTHGGPLKDASHYYTAPNEIDYCICTSEGMRAPFAYDFAYDINRMIPLGYPRNDVFSETAIDVKSILKTKCSKVVVWYPTFKQQKDGRKTGVINALPVLYDSGKAKTLNEFLIENDVLVVLKPHFAQDVSYINDLKLTNIRFINDDFFVQNNITSYQFIAGCDALLSDYSSVYYDFTLCDKPIGVIWEDVDDYRKDPGLTPNIDYLMKGAEKLYTLDDLMRFIRDVISGIDNLKKERREIRDFANISTDGHNTERVVNFIIEKAKL